MLIARRVHADESRLLRRRQNLAARHMQKQRHHRRRVWRQAIVGGGKCGCPACSILDLALMSCCGVRRAPLEMASAHGTPLRPPRSVSRAECPMRGNGFGLESAAGRERHADHAAATRWRAPVDSAKLFRAGRKRNSTPLAISRRASGARLKAANAADVRLGFVGNFRGRTFDEESRLGDADRARACRAPSE